MHAVVLFRVSYLSYFGFSVLRYQLQRSETVQLTVIGVEKV